MKTRAIQLHGQPLGGGRFPAICAPLVGRTRDQLLAETEAVAAKMPDLLEWRVDFYEGIADTADVVEAAALIKQAAGGIPVLFTRRCSSEGGEPIALDEAQVIALYRAVCDSAQVDFIDYEMSHDAAQVAEVRELSWTRGVQLVLSFHDFQRTPGAGFLNERFAQAQRLGADIAKVAVMPRGMEDVLTLLGATLQSSMALRIPVVSMSMAGPGSITRLCGWAFGSALTFAVGERPSAPGQIPIEELEAALAVMRKAFGTRL